jgi:hypothetical protein
MTCFRCPGILDSAQTHTHLCFLNYPVEIWPNNVKFTVLFCTSRKKVRSLFVHSQGSFAVTYAMILIFLPTQRNGTQTVLEIQSIGFECGDCRLRFIPLLNGITT